jgi:hypothetical protein
MAAAAADTVTIACKLPNGFFMTIHKLEKYSVPVLGGGTRDESRAVPLNDPIRIKGPAAPQGVSPRAPVIGGYALTSGVPKDVADKWFEENKSSAMVKNRVVFVAKTDDAARGIAKDQADLTSGMERLNPDMTTKAGKSVPKDPRWPRSSNPHVTMPATDTRQDSE